MRSNKILVGAASLVILIAAVFYIISTLRKDTHGVHQVYYINDTTLEQTLGPGDRFPPLSRPEGELVWGFYYSCDGCKTRQLGYLQKYSPEAKQHLEESAAQHGGQPDMGVSIAAAGELWVRTPVKGSTWYPIRSNEGMQITAGPNCGGRPQDYGPCTPQDVGR